MYVLGHFPWKADTEIFVHLEELSIRSNTRKGDPEPGQGKESS